MHPILANRERLLLYLTAWFPIAALLTAILARGGDMSWLVALLIAAPMCLLYALMCLGSWYICRAAVLRSGPTLSLVGMLATVALVYSTAWVLLGRSWVALLEVIPSLALLSNKYVDQSGVLFVSGVLLFLLAVAVHYLLLVLEQSRSAEKRALQHEVLAREAELRALRAQIDPHFLFNSLNSISALTAQDPKAARRMCQLLADFMRTSLAVGSKTEIALAEELKIAEGFLEIEKVRFGDRLSIDMRVESDCADCLVPPLLIQPLVENAVTHGIAPLIDGGTLSIAARQVAGVLEIVIENPYDSESTPKTGTGLGIRNVRERIASLFAENARVEIARTDHVFRVGLKMPCVRNGVSR